MFNVYCMYVLNRSLPTLCVLYIQETLLQFSLVDLYAKIKSCECTKSTSHRLMCTLFDVDRKQRIVRERVIKSEIERQGDEERERQRKRRKQRAGRDKEKWAKTKNQKFPEAVQSSFSLVRIFARQTFTSI